MSKTLAKYNWKSTGYPVIYNKSTFESLVPMFPIIFYDDFLGADTAVPDGGSEESGCKWSTKIVKSAGSPTVAKVADAIGGVMALTLTNTDEAQGAGLYWGDQEALSLEKGLIFEARVTFNVLPLTGTETVQAVFGLAGAYHVTPDTVDCNAWFRVESAANTVLLWEVDDNTANNDDDNTCAGITLVAGTYNIFRIDATDISAVKFYVDGVLVGTGNMDGLTAAIGNVQPYFMVSKAKTTTQTGTGTMYIDYVRVFQDRE